MSIPAPPIDFNQPIPGGPFFSPLESSLSANVGPLIVGSGLTVDYASGIITAVGGSGIVSSVIAGTGISVSSPSGNVTISNTGVTSLTAGAGISVSSATGEITISSTGGTVTSINTGTGLTGGPITTSGTISLDASGASAGSYTYPSITVDTYGRVTLISDGVPPVTSVSGSSPILVSGGTTPTISITSASTTAAGAVQLNDTTASTSTSQALTAAQGKILQDQIDALSFSSNLTFAGTVDATTGTMATVTAEAAAVGFVIGSPLPTPDLTNRNFFAIVTTPGVMTPPGGSAQLCHRGDWWLSSGTVWEFLDVGYNVAYASTADPGIIQLATDAEVQAGTDNSLAVVPTALQSKLSDSVSLTSSTTIASSTAAKIAYDAAVTADNAANAAQTDATQALADAAAAQTDATQALADAAAAQTDATQALTNAASAQATADAALPLSGGTLTGPVTFAAGQTIPAGSIQDGTLTQKGVVQLNNSVSSTSDTEAATPSAVKVAADAAGVAQTDATQALSDAASAQAKADAALPLTGGSMSGVIVFDPTQTFDISGIQDGTLTQKGVVQLDNSTSSTSDTTAATPSAIRQVNIVAAAAQSDATQALSDAAAAQTDASQALVDAAAAQATADAALPLSGGTLTGTVTFAAGQTIPLSSIQDGTLSQKGVVQLSDSVSSTSNDFAATPAAVKQAYDAGVAAQIVANAALPKSGGTMTGVITFDPSQTFPISGIQSASTTQVGVVALATDGETQTGTDTNRAVTPAALQSKISDSTSTSSSTTIASSSAVCSAYSLADSKVSCLSYAATGDILVASSSSTPTALAVGTNGTVLTACSACTTGLVWANPAIITYSATKSITNATPIDLLSWSGGVRMGTLTVMGYEGTLNRVWANVIISANTGIGDSTVATASAGSFGTFSIIAGGGGETILTFTPNTTITGVNFTYQYIAAFGSQPTAL